MTAPIQMLWIGARPVPDAPGISGVHLWNEMWRRSGIDKDARYPPYGAYEQLKQRYLRMP